MATVQIQYRGGTEAQHAAFTGAVREATIDTDNWCWVIHDGVTAGGHPQASQEWVTDQLAAISNGAATNLFLHMFCK